MYESVPEQRRMVPVLIVVLVVLAGVFGTGAYVVARQTLAARADAQATGGSPGSGASASPGGNGGSSARASTGGTGAQPGASQTSDPGASCPAVTLAAVQAAGRPGKLERQLYVDGQNGSRYAEAWICQDSDGTLFYQGHNKTGPITGATTDNTILLGTGVRGSVVRSGQGFVATNIAAEGPTQYLVTRAQLIVVFPGGDKDSYTVTRYEPS